MGDDGIFEHANSNQVLVDHSTVDVKTSKDCFESASSKGLKFLDAPISGGPGGAADGTLTIMVGGEKESFDNAKYAFSMMGAKISYMGPSGAGTAMKLVNQLLVSTNTVAAAEAFVLAEQSGVNLNAAIDILSTSWGRSTMIERNGPITVNKEFENSPAPLRNLVKDLGIIKELTTQLGLKLPVTMASSDVVDETMGLNLEEPDIAATALSIKKISNKNIKTAQLENDLSGPFLEKVESQKNIFEPIKRDKDDIASILYTSGTTGRSKGAMLTHNNLVSNTKSLFKIWKFSDNDILLHALPIYHIHGLFVAFNICLFSGAKINFLEKFELETVIEKLPKSTVMMGVPTYYTRMLQSLSLIHI